MAHGRRIIAQLRGLLANKRCSTKVLFLMSTSPLSIINGGAMSQRTRKRQSDHVALTLTPIVEAYLERIEWALTYGSDIVVFSDDPGAVYVRHVKDHPRPKTLRIGPVSVEEVDALVAFIRSRIDFSGTPTVTGEQFTTPEFYYPT